MSEDKILSIYPTKECKIPISAIEWNVETIIKLITGEVKRLKNTARAGQIVSVTVYIRNESDFPYAITEITYPDKRVKISVNSGWMDPWVPIELTVKFIVPQIVTPQSVIKADKITIKGNYIYEAR